MFGSFKGSSQVEINKNENFVLTLVVKVGNEDVREYFLTGVEIIKITPVGNMSRILTFKIDPANKIMELANPMAFLRVRATGDFNGDGDTETIVDEFSVLTKTGNLKLVYHINGN
jgi:hypothetical protein